MKQIHKPTFGWSRKKQLKEKYKQIRTNSKTWSEQEHIKNLNHNFGKGFTTDSSFW